MKYFFFIFLIFVIGCSNTSNHKIDPLKQTDAYKIRDFIMHKDRLVLNGNEGNWYYKQKLFSGYAVKYYPNNSLREKTGFLNGKKQGVYTYWFNNRLLKLESNYNQNILVGTYKVWWNNGAKALESFYLKGKKEGVERQWFKEGALSKERNLENGREHGLQRAWLKNGKIYVNYEAKNGRIFGMKRANLCYQLKNEKISEIK